MLPNHSAPGLFSPVLRHHRAGRRFYPERAPFYTALAGGGCERLAELVRRDPENQEAAHALVIVLYNEHRNRQAMEIMRGIVRANPASPTALDGLVKIAARTHWTGIPCLPTSCYGFAGLMLFSLPVLPQ